jgi:membrane protein DedA with SNARE-associated domain
VDLKTAILTAFLGLLIGDIIGFYLGRKLGEEYIKSHAKKLKITPQKYNKIKFLINGNLIKALFIGRTTNITRWIVPFLAGANNADFKKFVLANIITGFFWSSVFILGGYFLGDIFEVYGKYFGLGILAATVIAYFIYRFYKHYQKYFQKEDTKLLILNIFGLYLFSKMLEDVIDLEVIKKWDFYISSHIHEIYNPLLNKIMIFITSLDNPLEVTMITYLKHRLNQHLIG